MRLCDYEADYKAEFPILPDQTDEDNATITIRLLSPGDRQDIQDRSIKRRFVHTDAGSQVETEYDNKSDREITITRMIVDWNGIFADKDRKKPLHVTDKNKLRLIRTVPGLSEHLMDCQRKLADQKAKEDGEAEKNS